MYAGADKGGSDEEEDEDDNEENEGDDNDDENETEEINEDECDSEEDSAAVSGSVPTASGPMALPPPRDFCPEENQLTFIEISGGKGDYPIGLAFVEAIRDRSIVVRWYENPKPLTTAVLRSGKSLKFGKTWNTRGLTLKEMEIDMGLRNQRGEKKRKPPTVPKDKLQLYWHTQTFETGAGVFVPVTVPFSQPVEKLWECG